MRHLLISVAVLSLGPVAAAQEIVDQQIKADAFVYTGEIGRAHV